MKSLRRTRLASLAAAGSLLLVLPPAARADGPVVLPGYDLFTTLSSTRIGVDPDGATGPARQQLVSFTSEPLGTFDFGSGPRDVGGADTIVRRFEAATPEDGLGAVELVALQLRSVDPVGYYATLQSDRGRHPLDPPDGLPSTGTIDIDFAPDGLGGTYRIQFQVNYDVRQGSPDGPIVAMGTTPMGGEDEWSTARSGEAVVQCHRGDFVVHVPELEEMGVYHLHCTVAAPASTTFCGIPVRAIPGIPGVNVELDGRSTASDFHPGHAADQESCSDTDVAAGQLCELVSETDFTYQGGETMLGYLRGGPVAATQRAGSTVSMACSVQVGAANATHAGADSVSAQSSPGIGVTALPPTLVSYLLPEGQPAYVCSQVTIDGVTYYWNGRDGGFSTSNTVAC